MVVVGIDVVIALIMGYVEEVVGIVRAVEVVGFLVIVLFMVEIDGWFLLGMLFVAAIEVIDVVIFGYFMYYMINCVYFVYFDHVFDSI